MYYPTHAMHKTVRFEAEERRREAALYRQANLARKERRAKVRALRKQKPWVRQRLPRPVGWLAQA